MRTKRLAISLSVAFLVVGMIPPALALEKLPRSTELLMDTLTKKLGFEYVRTKHHSDGVVEVQYAGIGMGCTIYINPAGQLILSSISCMDRKAQAAGGGTLRSDNTLRWAGMTYAAINGSSAGVDEFGSRFKKMIGNWQSGAFTIGKIYTNMDLNPDGSGFITMRCAGVKTY